MASQRRKPAPRKRRTRRGAKVQPRPKPNVRRRLPAAAEAALRSSPNDLDTMQVAPFIGDLARFRDLTSHPLYPQIHGRLISGYPSFRLAGWIQDRVPETDPLGRGSLKLHSLARKLQRYARRLPKSIFLPVSFLENLIKDAEADVDTMQNLAALIAYQKERLAIGRQTEREFKMPMEQQRREVEQLANLLRQMRDTQIAFGLIPTADRVVTVLGGSPSPIGGHGLPGEGALERLMAEHPELLSEMLPTLERLDTMKLEPKNVTPKEAQDDDR